MEKGEAIGRCRTALFALTVAVFALTITIIAISFTPSDWISVEQTSPLDASVHGANLDVSTSVTIKSSMPYDIDDLDVSICLADPGRGSSVPLYHQDGIVIRSNSMTEVNIQASVMLPVAALVIKDMALDDGDPLRLCLKVGCGYFMGLMSFKLVSEIEIPVAAEGEKISYRVTEDTEHAYSLEVSGLAEWLTPDGMTAIVSGGGEEAVLSISGSGSTVVMSASSDSDLDGVLARIASAGDYHADDGHGNELDLSSDDLHVLDDALQYARGRRCRGASMRGWGSGTPCSTWSSSPSFS